MAIARRTREGLFLILAGLAGVCVSGALLAFFGYAFWVGATKDASSKQSVPAVAAAAPDEDPNEFGAVEIGSSGIKGTIWKISPERARYLLSEDAETGGSRYAGFADALVKHFDDTHDSLEDNANVPKAVFSIVLFVAQMRAEHVPKNNILIVASSGVADLPELGDITASVAAKTGIKPAVLSAEDECRLTFDWIVPLQRTYEALVIDEGSGNTKACYVEHAFYSDNYRSFELMSYGTQSFARRVASERKPGESFADASSRVREELLPLIHAAAEQYPGLIERPRIYLVGGGAYEVATLAHAGAVNDDWVSLSVPSDFKTVRARAVLGSPYDLDLSDIVDDDTRRAAAKELGHAAKVFDPDELTAGMDVLLAIDKGLDLHRRGAVVKFARRARDGWIARYLMQDIARRTPPKRAASD